MRRLLPILALIGCPADEPPIVAVPPGSKLREPAIDHLMRVDVRSLDNAVQSERDSIIIGRDLHDHLSAADGTEVEVSWRALIVALEGWQEISAAPVWISIDSPSSDRRGSYELVARLEDRVRAVNEKLGRHGYRLVMQADLDLDRFAWRLGFLAFAIEGTVDVRVGETRRVTTDVRRIDGGRELEPFDKAYGTVVDWLAPARTTLVLHDNLDRAVIRWLPVLIGAPSRNSTAAWNDSPGTRALGILVATALRTELFAFLGDDAATAQRIAWLLAEREAVLPELEETRAVILAASFVERLPEPTRSEIREIEAALVALEAPRIVARCVKALTQHIRHHEIQHVLDYESPEWGTLSRPIEAGPLTGLVHAELSAYVAALASEMIIPRFALWFPVAGAIQTRDLSSAEGYVGALMVEKLAKQFGIASPGSVIHDGAVDLDRLVSLSFALASHSTDEIRGAAAAIWTELRGAPFVPLTSQ